MGPPALLCSLVSCEVNTSGPTLPPHHDTLLHYGLTANQLWTQISNTGSQAKLDNVIILGACYSSRELVRRDLEEAGVTETLNSESSLPMEAVFFPFY